MLKYFKYLSLLFLSSLSFAQINSYQPFQPARSNYIERNNAHAPSDPSSMSSADGRATFALSWTDNSSNETGFEIYLDVDGGGYSLVHTTAANVTSYTYSGSLTIGSVYTFKVRAINTSGGSGYALASAATHIYKAGYPTVGPSEPHVKAQFLFDESANSIVDEVSGITLTKSGSPTYSVVQTGLYADLSPAITYGANIEHQKLSATSSLNIGASDDAIFEWWDSANANVANMYSWSYNAHLLTDLYGIIVYYPSLTGMNVTIGTEEDVGLVDTLDANFTVPNWYDGRPHHFRLELKRSDSLTLKVDGATCAGSISLAAMSGETIVNTGLRMAGQYNGGGNKLVGQKTEWRASIGTDVINNNSAPSFAVQPTEKWLLNQHSGDLVSVILKDTYSATGSFVYDVAGTYNNGIQADADSYFRAASINAALNPQSQNFVLAIEAAAANTGTGYQFILDAGNAGSSLAGYAVTADNTNLYFSISDGTHWHYTYAARAGIFPKDGSWHKLLFIVNKALGKVIFKIDGSVISTSDNGVSLTTVGSVSSGGGFALFSQSAVPDSQVFRGSIHRVDFKKNSTTYDY